MTSETASLIKAMTNLPPTKALGQEASTHFEETHVKTPCSQQPGSSIAAKCSWQPVQPGLAPQGECHCHTGTGLQSHAQDGDDGRYETNLGDSQSLRVKNRNSNSKRLHHASSGPVASIWHQ